MTAKEKLIRDVLNLDEAEAEAARIVIERKSSEAADGELEAILDIEGDELLDEMDAEERKAGLGRWKT